MSKVSIGTVMIFDPILSRDEIFMSRLKAAPAIIINGLDQSKFPKRRVGNLSAEESTKRHQNFDSRALKFYSLWSAEMNFSHVLELVNFELSREPGYDFERAVDRSPTSRTLLLYWINRLLTEKPDLCVFNEAPHGAWNLTAMLVAEKMKIKQLWFQAADPVAPIVFPRDLLGILELGQSSNPPSQLSTKYLDLMSRQLENLSQGNKPINATELERQLSSWSFLLKKYSAALAQRPRRMMDITPRLNLGRTFWEKIVFSLKNRIIRRRFLDLQPKGEISSAPGEYFYFSMHYQPEKTSIPDGPLVPFQGDLVARIRSTIPQSHLLVVKEHPHQLIRQDGHYGRSPITYDFLESIPGVLLLGAQANSKTLIRNSKAVITITGSAGLEALMTEIPAWHLGEPWWKGAPGSAYFDDNFEILKGEPLKTKSANEVRKWLVDHASTKGFPGFATPARKAFWSRILTPQDIAAIEDAERDGVLKCIQAMLVKNI